MSAFELLGLKAGGVLDKDGKAVELSDLAGKVLGLYFSAHWCGPCRNFTPRLAAKYREIVAAGGNFEILFFSADEDEESASKYFAEMPWKMVSFEDRQIMKTFMQKYEVEGFPTITLLDEQGEVISLDACDLVLQYPFNNWKTAEAELKAAEERRIREIEELKANFNLHEYFKDITLKRATGSVALQDKIIGLYFSAHWCPPCRGFTPVLAKRYTELIEAGKPFEIIFISSDRSEAEADEYFADMPWTMLPFSERKHKATLSDVFDIRGIPTLLLFGEDGKLLSNNGREVVSTPFEDWKDFDAKKKAKQEELARKISTFPEVARIDAHEHDLKKLPHVYHGFYGCDICGQGGEAWVYHCDECGYDAHPLCVFQDK